VVLSGKNSPTGYAIQEGAGISARNENTLALNATFIRPLDCDAVCGILARQSECSGQPSGSYLLQANQTNTDKRVSVVKLRSERLRKEPLHHCRVCSEIHEQPSLDRAFYDRNTHKDAA